MLKRIVESKLFLKELTINDASEKYANWLNNEIINQYLEPLNEEQTPKTVKKYILEKQNSDNEFLYGIFYKDNHIGNIKVGNINYNHLVGDIGYFIGDTHYWGRGIATLAIKNIIKLCADLYKLEKVTAGIYDGNVASEKVLIKCNFSLEGKRKKHVLFKGKRIDYLEFGRVLK